MSASTPRTDRAAGLADHPAVLVRPGRPRREPRRRARARDRAEHALARLHRRAVGGCHRARRRARRDLGALLADSPHTRPVPVTGDLRRASWPRGIGLEPSRYKGPTGIVGRAAGLPAPAPASRRCRFWAAVPHYVAQAPCPKATLALLRQLEDLLDLTDPPGGPARGGAGLGARRRRAGRSRTPRSPSTCARWRRPRTPPTCPRPPATRSPASSSATCAGAEPRRRRRRLTPAPAP